MRYHKGGLSALASLPSHLFDREGLLLLRERSDSFFRRSEVSCERWCRLRGNLLFYLKTRDHWSEACGVIVLEHCKVTVEDSAPHAFTIVWGGGGGGQVCEAASQADRDAWVTTITRCAPAALSAQLASLQEAVDSKKALLDARIASASKAGTNIHSSSSSRLELSLSCDNLPCVGASLPPVACAVVQLMPRDHHTWNTCHTTEVIKSSNPDFLSTVVLGGEKDGGVVTGAVDAACRVRIVVRRMLEPLSCTSTVIGSASTTVGAVSSAGRLRLALVSLAGETSGFVTLTCWAADGDAAGGVDAAAHVLQGTPTHASTVNAAHHRRTQSLPPRLSSKSRPPQPPALCPFHTNPSTATYRFHSGLGGDIAVVEIMAESRLSLTLPQQLLKIWQGAERAWQEELEALGELSEPWASRQRALVAMHASRNQLYADAASALAACVAKGQKFKRSADKEDPLLEFAPINLHLQRMWAQNETLKRTGFHDVHTVGAFAANALGCGHGGLLTQLQDQSRRDRGEASSRADCSRAGVESTRRLRSALAASLNSLLGALKRQAYHDLQSQLADVQEKIDLLLSALEQDVVESAFDFLDQIKIPQSPSHLVTLASRNFSVHSNLSGYLSPESSLDKTIGQHLRRPQEDQLAHADTASDDTGRGDVDLHRRRDTAFDRTPDVRLTRASGAGMCLNECASSFDNEGIVEAKYYCATDEPEPWDLIKLNLQASFICLSSKVNAICNSYNQKKECRSPQDGLAPLAKIDGLSEISAASCDALTAQTTSADVSPTEEDSGIGLERNTPDIERRLSSDAATSKSGFAGATSVNISGQPRDLTNAISIAQVLYTAPPSGMLPGNSSDGSTSLNASFEKQIINTSNCSTDEIGIKNKLSSILEASKENIHDNDLVSSNCSRDIASQLVNPSSTVSTLNVCNEAVDNCSAAKDSRELSFVYVNHDIVSTTDAAKNADGTMYPLDCQTKLQGSAVPSGKHSTHFISSLRDSRSMHASAENGVTQGLALMEFSNVSSAKSNHVSNFTVDSTRVADSVPNTISVNGCTPLQVDQANDSADISSSANDVLNSSSNSRRLNVLHKTDDGPSVTIVVPSIIKLRGAVDGAVRTARLVHSLHKLQLSTEVIHKTHSLQYRRDVCFSQALTAAVSGLVACLWSRVPDVAFLTVLQQLGPLLQFEGLLSCYGSDAARLSDMVVAVEDLATVQFVLVPCSLPKQHDKDAHPRVVVTGNRCGLRVLLPVPESLLCFLSEHHCAAEPLTFNVTPVFFNVGINEEATLAGRLRLEGPQHRNNLDSFHRLAEYHHRYAKLDLPADTTRRSCCGSNRQSLSELMERLSKAVQSSKSKNTETLHLAAAVTRVMGGIRFTSCKSGKDRTGMSVTLEQVNLLTTVFDLARTERHQSLQAMRSDGTRILNCKKNISVKKFAFNAMQLTMFPRDYAPPPGSYGATAT